MMRRLLPVLVAALACAAVAVAVSAAPAAALKKAIWGPSSLVRPDVFKTYDDLGVDIVQETLHWDKVAPKRPADPSDPNDPAYEWPREVSRTIEDAAKNDVAVSVTIIGAPSWANGHDDWRWVPNPDDFATFTEAASRRYPSVHYWLIWAEPTKGENFQPQPEDTNRPRTSEELEGPRAYARVLDAAYGAVKKVQRSDLVIGGNTFTVGNIAPLYYPRALRLPNGKPPRMDLWGHNPFSARKPVLDAVPLGNGYADFSDIDQLVKRIDKNLKGAKPGGGKIDIFISEYALPTDHPNYLFNFFVSRKQQANWIGVALREARRYKRIFALGYLGLYDDDPRADNQQVEWGLMTREGERKPSYQAYKRG